jgi:hypothetical protein
MQEKEPRQAIGASLETRGELTGGREDEQRGLETTGRGGRGVGKLTRGSPQQRIACRRRSTGDLGSVRTEQREGEG